MSTARAATLALAGRFEAALAALTPSETRSEHGRWVRAYVAAARGQLRRAEQIAEPLARAATDRSVRHAACITLGSSLRQQGRHREASAWDRRALNLARTRSERAHALVGLAADAVGQFDVETCATRLSEAVDAAARTDLRVQIRIDWVRTEHALLTRRPSIAARAAGRALDRSRRARLRRHEAKSLLFLGVALAEARHPRAIATLERAGVLAERIGARAIERVARSVARRLARA